MGNMLEAVKRLGLEGMVHREWVSASEGAKFKEIVTEFIERIRALDPSPLRAE
jgi:F420-non-reducing hydrogenase iron-sulfur subunit